MDKFRQLSTAIRPVLHAEGKEYLYFGGTAYLGIPQDPEFLELYLEGLKLYGINNGTSRRNNVQLAVYDDAEQVAAERFGAGAALITSSGYLAAQMAVKYAIQTGEVIYAPDTHPALWATSGTASKTPDSLTSFAEWADQTVSHINESEKSHWVLISNSLNNLFPEIYGFGFVNDIHPDKKLLLVVDDSHGMGILNQGHGAFPSLPRRPNTEWIVVASMAKALGVDAGLVLSSARSIAELKNTPEFLGASPPAAAALHTFMHGAAIYSRAFTALQKNDAYFRQLLTGLPVMQDAFRSVTGLPVFLSADAHLVDKLFSKDILISSFPYPDSSSQPINRIVLSSWHRPEHIESLITALSAEGAPTGITD